MEGVALLLGELRMQFPVPLAIEHPELLTYRDEFPLLQHKTYLNSSSLGALSQRSIQGMARFMEVWNEWGAHAWYDVWMDEIAQARKNFASLIGAQIHEVAIAPSVSAALSSIASALDYKARKKVVLSNMDFPTLAYQWLAKERLGVECRFVKSPDGVYMPPDLFGAEIDNQTALVATSHVYYTSGYIQDIRSIADMAHKNGAYILVDDYQGTGQIPVNVNALDVDFLVSGTLKWLMGGPGLAFVYIREGLLSSLVPTIAGWFGHHDQFQFRVDELVFRPEATRMEMGTPSMAAVYAANGGMDIVLEASVKSICERTRYLTNDLIARARERGWMVRAPQEPDLRSSIVMIELGEPQEVVNALIARNIVVDARSDLLRISPYFYNTIEENELIIEAIAEILEQKKKA